MSKNSFVDVHCHSTLRAFNSIPLNGAPNIWDQTGNSEATTAAARWARMTTKDISKESQSNFYNLINGNVGVVFDSLYPVEKGFLNLRRVPSALMGKKGMHDAMSVAMGVCPNRLRKLKNRKDYFIELLEQYTFLVKGQGDSPDGQQRYKMVADYAQLEELREKEPDTLAVVVTIEGAHAFGSGSPKAANMAPNELRDMLTENILTVKSWEYPPFFVNLAHHFWNQLCGHIKSMKPPMGAIFNQSTGLNTGITELGWHVLREMLTRKNGRRILVDTKHMSMKSRLEYYKFVEANNYINPDDKIPVICSHTGVNGFRTMKASMAARDKKKKMKRHYFHSWMINLSDEEIRFIHESGGIMGFMMDKGLLGGTETLAEIKAIEDADEQKQAFLKLLWSAIFQMVKAVGKPEGWDSVVMGTDFDGLINHIDCYNGSLSLPVLHRDLIDYLSEHKFHRELWYDYSPKQIVDKIMSTNAMDFMKKHFK